MYAFFALYTYVCISLCASAVQRATSGGVGQVLTADGRMLSIQDIEEQAKAANKNAANAGAAAPASSPLVPGGTAGVADASASASVSTGGDAEDTTDTTTTGGEDEGSTTTDMPKERHMLPRYHLPLPYKVPNRPNRLGRREV